MIPVEIWETIVHFINPKYYINLMLVEKTASNIHIDDPIEKTAWRIINQKPIEIKIKNIMELLAIAYYYNSPEFFDILDYLLSKKKKIYTYNIIRGVLDMKNKLPFYIKCGNEMTEMHFLINIAILSIIYTSGQVDIDFYSNELLDVNHFVLKNIENINIKKSHGSFGMNFVTSKQSLKRNSIYSENMIILGKTPRKVRMFDIEFIEKGKSIVNKYSK